MQYDSQIVKFQNGRQVITELHPTHPDAIAARLTGDPIYSLVVSDDPEQTSYAVSLLYAFVFAAIVAFMWWIATVPLVLIIVFAVLLIGIAFLISVVW